MEKHINDLTSGNIKKTVIRFAVPYLFACFLQAFYGLVDLFVVGLYDPTEASTAVAIGSQFMHVITVMMIGLSLGATVCIGQSVGAGDRQRARRTTGTSIVFFGIVAVVLMTVLLLLSGSIVHIMLTPAEAVPDTLNYLRICFAGLPFIIAFNVISSIYRGYGDSKNPLFFVGIACVVNIILDFVFIGALDLGAAGAALGTVCGQAASVIVAVFYTKRHGTFELPSLHEIRIFKSELSFILRVGIPIFAQEGLIQLSFIIIQIIGNNRGLIDATSIGVVEKFIGFLFLVPSAFLSAISAITAQNYGANRRDRAREALRFAILINLAWSVACFIFCQCFPGAVISVFRREPEIIFAATAYLRSYLFDVIFACVHFCFSGYFNGSSHSGVTFFHNIVSAILIRIPGAYFLSKFFPQTLTPMGAAAPAGSLFSILICLIFYHRIRKKEEQSTGQNGVLVDN